MAVVVKFEIIVNQIHGKSLLVILKIFYFLSTNLVTMEAHVLQHRMVIYANVLFRILAAIVN